MSHPISSMDKQANLIILGAFYLSKFLNQSYCSHRRAIQAVKDGKTSSWKTRTWKNDVDCSNTEDCIKPGSMKSRENLWIRRKITFCTRNRVYLPASKQISSKHLECFCVLDANKCWQFWTIKDLHLWEPRLTWKACELYYDTLPFRWYMKLN